jgi:hypothetical protein
MAVISNPNDPNNPQNQAQTGPDGQPLQTVGTAAPSGQGPAGTPMARSAANSLAQNQRQGSGRFTNIQKYLQANQRGSQNIAQQIGQNINQNFQKQQQQAQQYQNQLGQNIQQANQTAQAGSGYQQQLGQIGQDIKAAQEAGYAQRANQGQLGSLEAFTQAPTFQQFQDIQAGRGIDESLLALQQQKSLSAAQQAAQGAQEAQQALGSEGGRFDLIRRTFGDGRSGYTQGQQRLDQVLLGQGGGLGGLQSQAAQQASTALAQQQQAAASRADVGRLTAQEQGLIKDINDRALANEQEYINMLSSYGGDLQKERQADFESLGNSLTAYIPTYDEKKKTWSEKAFDVNNQGLTSEQMQRLGLTDSNQGVYNVFKDEAFTKATGKTPEERNAALASAIAKKGQEVDLSGGVRTAQDVANEADVKRYQALAKIIGSNFNPQITQASQIGDTYLAKGDDEGGLKGRLDAAQKIFDDVTSQKVMSGHAVYSYPTERDWMGNKKFKPADVHRYARGSVEDMIAKGRLGLDNQQGSIVGNINQVARNRAVAQLKNLLEQENYARTLGGKRETFLNAEEAARIAAEKAKNRVQEKVTPAVIPGENTFAITGADPSLEYRQQRGDPNDPYNKFIGAGTKGLK